MISNGHTLEAIRDYTLAQVRTFTDAMQKREKALYMQAIAAARMAQYDSKQFKKAMKALKEDG